MLRRQFIRNLGIASAGMACAGANAVSAQSPRQPAGKVMTVLGPVSADELGFTLTHEHILVDFVGADRIRAGGYDYELVARRALPHLRELKQLGVDTLVECTPAYLGRDPVLLKRLSEETGIHLVTNTGYYGTRDGIFVPSAAQRLSARELAVIWINEAVNGIGNTGIRPGFIKTAVNQGPLGELDRKLIRAAAIAHRETGLSIHSHTTRTAVSGDQQLEVLQEEGVDARAWVWVHAHSVPELEDLRNAFERGAWISFDNLRPDVKSVGRMLDCLEFARDNNWLDQVLVSHDAGWFDPAKPDGGEHRPYTPYFTHLIDAAAKSGIAKDVLGGISRKNAYEAMKIGTRLG